MAADEKYGVEAWQPFQVSAFVEGAWIDILRKLDQKNQASKREEERLKRESPEKLAGLKKDFGIE
jgi:hypothetical protein